MFKLSPQTLYRFVGGRKRYRLDRIVVCSRSLSGSGRGRGGALPLDLHIVWRQRVARSFCEGRIGAVGAADRTGMVRRTFVRDDVIELPRPGLCALSDDRRGLTADFTRRRLAFAELAHIGDGGGGGGDRLGCAKLRQLVRIRRFVPGQQHQNQPDPERQAKQEQHLATPNRLSSVPISGDLSSDIRFISRRARLRMSEPKGTLAAVDKSQVFALTLNRKKPCKNFRRFDST